ncbi:hypothetical protein XENORESO_008449 [Xenotaenia resolanae]|uniref:Secreted protein n=1 Tax=Xenotaenia resolanae TaxID=208358 RepID=A0ABV0WVU3_9TELE
MSQWKRGISNPRLRILHRFFCVLLWRLAYNEVVHYRHQLAWSVDQNVADPHSSPSCLFKSQTRQPAEINRKCCAKTLSGSGFGPGFGDPWPISCLPVALCPELTDILLDFLLLVI